MFDFGFVGLVVIIDDGSMNDGFVCVCHQKEKDLLFIMLLVRLFITYVRRIGTKFRRFSNAGVLAPHSNSTAFLARRR